MEAYLHAALREVHISQARHRESVEAHLSTVPLALSAFLGLDKVTDKVTRGGGGAPQPTKPRIAGLTPLSKTRTPAEIRPLTVDERLTEATLAAEAAKEAEDNPPSGASGAEPSMSRVVSKGGGRPPGLAAMALPESTDGIDVAGASAGEGAPPSAQKYQSASSWRDVQSPDSCASFASASSFASAVGSSGDLLARVDPTGCGGSAGESSVGVAIGAGDVGLSVAASAPAASGGLTAPGAPPGVTYSENWPTVVLRPVQKDRPLDQSSTLAKPAPSGLQDGAGEGAAHVTSKAGGAALDRARKARGNNNVWGRVLRPAAMTFRAVPKAVRKSEVAPTRAQPVAWPAASARLACRKRACHDAATRFDTTLADATPSATSPAHATRWMLPACRCAIRSASRLDSRSTPVPLRPTFASPSTSRRRVPHSRYSLYQRADADRTCDLLAMLLLVLMPRAW